MKPHLLIFLLSTYQLSGQLTENFEKSEISNWYSNNETRWKISTEKPISGNFSLHHAYDNNMSDHDQISMLHDPLILDSAKTSWKFGIRHEYNPSAFNHWAVFLVSDKNAASMHPDGSCNGYILGVNYTGSEDFIKFWKSINGEVSEIMNTGFNWQNEVGKDTPATFEIIRYQTGRWVFFIDTTLNHSCKIKLGEIEDTELKASRYFGLYYKYSSGQDQKLWFDDIYINGFFFKDTIPPVMKSVVCQEPLHLAIQFNEPIAITADSQLEIKAALETRNIDSVKVSNESLLLWMKEPLLNESEISVKAYHIRDIYGNTNSCDSMVFFHYLPGFNDLIVNEIMADPIPSVNLPETEYLELYNRCKYPVNLFGWQIFIGNKGVAFGKDTIWPAEHMLLHNNQSPDLFNGIPRQMVMKDLPRISNDGQIIVLKDNQNKVIFSTEYHSSWYQDNYKSDGGWSLEMVDPDNPCGRKNNWRASIDVNGGTPGYTNSVAGYNPDDDNPGLLKSIIISDSSLYLHFSETVTGNNLYAHDNYLIDHEIGMPYLSVPGSDLLNSVILYFDRRFGNHIHYSLQIQNNLADCAGNILDKNMKFTFQKPMICDSMDLIINEILFDSRITGGEFIEIYNKSEKTIDLKDFYITIRDLYSDKQGPSYVISENPYAIEPGEYLVLAGNINLITNNYYVVSIYDFIEMGDIPNLPNTGAVISLCDPTNGMIDEVAYSPDMHIEIASNTRGVSLERINPHGLSAFSGNWTSASGNFGYATPGYKNSQFKKDRLMSFTVTTEPEIITPDCDGINDVTVIKYEAGDIGFLANIIVFDRTGRPVKIIARNMLLGSAGKLIWDGITSEGRPAPVGPYLIYTEVFNLSGCLKKFKNSCIIAEKIY